jgi:hypothetical protein
VDKFTPEEVENNNEEFAEEKAKPSNKMTFKTNNNRVIYCGNIHFRDERLQPTAQPAGGVICRVIYLSDRQLLPIVRQRGSGLVCYLLNGCVGGGGSHREAALLLRSSLGLVDDSVAGDVKGLVNFTSHCVKSGCGVVSSKWESKRLEGKSEK